MIIKMTCPRCNKVDVPLYEVELHLDNGYSCGPLHLAFHDCPENGDHMMIQSFVDLRTIEQKRRSGWII